MAYAVTGIDLLVGAARIGLCLAPTDGDSVHKSPVYGLKFHCEFGINSWRGALRAMPLRGSKAHWPFGAPRGLASGAP